MKMLAFLFMVFLLFACGSEYEEKASNNDNSSNDAEYTAESVEVQDPFKLELKSEKLQYKQGEQLNITAHLTYAGNEAITIGYGGSWIFLNTTNVTEGYQFNADMIQPFIATDMRPNEPIVEQYHFSGSSYGAGKGGKPYSDEVFEQMANMNFPPGQYKIEGITDFKVIGEDKTYKLEAEIRFDVIE